MAHYTGKGGATNLDTEAWSGTELRKALLGQVWQRAGQ